VLQEMNVRLCRTERATLLGSGLFTKPLLLWCVGVEPTLILLIDHTT
jgi:hypothetical protein